MKKTYLIILFWIVAQIAQGQKPWDDLNTYRQNKVQPHSIVVPYSNEEDINTQDYRSSTYYRSLNGVWKFLYVDSPEKIPTGSTAENYNISTWNDIQVPGNIELQGFGVPVYVNERNEFASNPPHPPAEYNPVGCYATNFVLPQEWNGRRTLIKFGAVKSALRLYVNGQYVGYSEDSKTPAEWDITKYLHPDTNRIVAQVLRWCDGSYLECQDMWRMSGITRDVAIYSVPQVYLSDYLVRACLDSNDYKNGIIDVTIDLSAEVRRSYIVEVELRDADNQQIMLKRRTLGHNDWFVGFSNSDCNLSEVHPWSHDNPYLYTLIVRLRNENDSILECIGGKIGFRTIHFRKGLLCINGEPLTIKGVNRHEHSGLTGHYVTREEMETDLRMMQQLGINAVRTSHYPNDEYWYQLCDEAGIYIWDEANVESHAQGYGAGSLAKNDDWSEPILYRINNMYRRDRNHASVIAWSLGNECGNGICMESAYRFLKGKDNTRPVTYERAEQDWNTDIVETMYPSLDALSEYARNSKNKRPYIMAEYCHAMGNSLGGLSDYWDTIHKYPILQGGFIWDWVDQSFIRHDSPNEEAAVWYALGGDLGTLPGIQDDDAFCANGLVSSDRQYHPHAWEVKAVYEDEIPDNEVNANTNFVAEHNGLDPVTISLDHSMVQIGNNRFSLFIYAADGSIISYQKDGKEMLAAPLRWNFWRPPTLNDLADKRGSKAWEGLDHIKPHLLSVTIHDEVQRPGSPTVAEAQLLLDLQAPGGETMRLKEIIETDSVGNIQISYMLAPRGSFRTLPKVGLQLGIDSSFSRTSFYGNLYEVYPDRRQAQHVGLWGGSTLNFLAAQHAVPQESGNREASWVSFEDEGRRLVIWGNNDAPMNFTIRNYEDSVITRARRINQLHKADHYVVSIDYKQAGLGTATCGPGVRTPYQLSGDSVYRYRFTIAAECQGKPWMNCEGGVTYFPEHPDFSNQSDMASDHPLQKVASVTSPTLPSEQYAKGFPEVLFDQRHGIVGDYNEGWIGYSGTDPVEFLVTLEKLEKVNQVSVGFCHSAHDWVIRPWEVQVQYSTNGKEWSPWQSCLMNNLPDDLANDAKRVRAFLRLGKKGVKNIRYIKVRVVGSKTLPIWHPYHGEPAWTMIDEIEIR